MSSAIPFTDKRWKTFQDAAVAVEATPDKAVITTNKGTDWWRTLERDSADGIVYGYQVDPSSGVDVSVKLDVAYEVQYDQAALFLQLGKHTWVKAGLEYDNNELYAGGVVTYPYSDWSIQKYPKGPATIRLTLKNRKLVIYLDGTMIREVNVFGDGDEKEATVGIMACSPLGGGARATFYDFASA